MINPIHTIDHLSQLAVIAMKDHERKQLSIRYSFAETAWGEIILASSSGGICALYFADDKDRALCELKQLFKDAVFKKEQDSFHRQAKALLDGLGREHVLPLHLWGTAFQQQVWQALLAIPAGKTMTYSQVAARIGYPKACRAVGNAVGANPVSLLVPCHRVVQASGKTGNYRWGADRKRKILASEAVQ
jgi:AraC family transcriptional regulator of adaptative response/methylated-DNA-[protein]-cysteine methyltransferase